MKRKERQSVLLLLAEVRYLLVEEYQTVCDDFLRERYDSVLENLDLAVEKISNDD